jgi:hypothetical protein
MHNIGGVQAQGFARLLANLLHIFTAGSCRQRSPDPEKRTLKEIQRVLPPVTTRPGYAHIFDSFTPLTDHLDDVHRRLEVVSDSGIQGVSTFPRSIPCFHAFPRYLPTPGGTRMRDTHTSQTRFQKHASIRQMNSPLSLKPRQLRALPLGSTHVRSWSPAVSALRFGGRTQSSVLRPQSSRNSDTL